MCCDWKVFTGPGILGAAWREGSSIKSMLMTLQSTHDQPKDRQPECRVHIYNLGITAG